MLIILDITSSSPFRYGQLFSPFYPHGNIPIPGESGGMTACCVEGIWQGLKVFELAGSDLLNISTISKRQFKDYFVHPHWNHIKEAVMEIFDRALDYRIKNPTIFMDMACGDRICENRKLNEAVEKIGCFAIRNSNDFIYKIPSRTHIAKESIDADWFISLHQFYNLLFTNDAIKKDRKGCKYIEKQCELMGWCHKNFVEKGESDITRNSYNCKQSPWLNISPNEIKQCSFGRLWLAFGGNRIKLKCIN